MLNRLNASHYHALFDEWKARYNLRDVHAHRLYAFADALDVVTDLRLNGAKHVGLNSMASLLPEELEAMKGFVPLSHNVTTVVAPSAVLMPAQHRHLDASGALAAAVDWTPQMSDVKTQGACAACWAFTATGLVEGMFAIKYKETISLSEQDFISCDRTRDRGCSGGNYVWALEDYASQHGVAAESDFRFGDVSKGCAMSARYVLASGQVEFVEGNELAMMTALQSGPLAVAISAYQPTFVHYSQGVFADAQGCGTTVDHSVLIVGYGTAADGTPFWRIKNSWGAGWGEAGYMRMARLGNLCGVQTQVNSLTDVSCLGSNATCRALTSREFCTLANGCFAQSNSSGPLLPTLGETPIADDRAWFTQPMGIVSVTASAVMLVLILVVVAVWRKSLCTRAHLAQCRSRRSSSSSSSSRTREDHKSSDIAPDPLL